MSRKGIVLAGGNGTRLRPLTYVTNKSLLPVYDKPMIFHPIETLKSLGCDDIMIVSSSEHVGQVVQLLGSGRDMGIKISYEIQDEARGIAHALGMCENWANNESVVVILGDNIYVDNDELIEEFNKSYKGKGACVFLKEVFDPERFGVASIDWTTRQITKIVEKPVKPESKYAVTGLYAFDSQVWEVIKGLKPSARGEYEITDVNNWYVNNSSMSFVRVNAHWIDAGTHDSLVEATLAIKNYRKFKKNLMKQTTND
jgi:glucose-1-phosphate thymidylyltransferase